MKIILNGKEVLVNRRKLTFDEIVDLVYPRTMPTVTYFRGRKSKPEGSLHLGQSVKVVEGMVVTCVVTGAA